MRAESYDHAYFTKAYPKAQRRASPPLRLGLVSKLSWKRGARPLELSPTAIPGYFELEKAKQILELHRDESKRTALGDRGRRAVREKYSWEMVLDKVESIYDEVTQCTK
jgi:hypothetical protein